MPRKAQAPIPGADPDRGAILLERYPEVTDAQAGSRTRTLYADMRRSLRVPFVNGVFRALANDLEFLEAAWAEVGPHLRTQDFEEDADALRRLALLRPVPVAEDLAVDLDHVRGSDQIRDFTDSVHYALPKLLLVAEMIDLTLVRSPHSRRETRPEADLPLGPAPGTVEVRQVRPKKLRGARRELLEDIRSAHGHPFVAGYYRGLARWPLVLEAVWNSLKPTVGTGNYVDHRRHLVEDAFQRASAYPVRGIDPQELGLDEAGVRELRDVLSVYRARIVPDLLIDATLVKSLLDGADAAERSRFSAATREKVERPRAKRTRRRQPARGRTTRRPRAASRSKPIRRKPTS